MKTTPTKPRTTQRVTLGRERFSKISAVEGLVLTDAARERAAEFDKKKMSAEERRRAIVRAYARLEKRADLGLDCLPYGDQ